jgi:D-xylose transport system substrate-binding protein
VNQQTDNGEKKVPSVILTPVAVTKDEIKDTIVKDGFWTTRQICAGRYASACGEAGIQ